MNYFVMTYVSSSLLGGVMTSQNNHRPIDSLSNFFGKIDSLMMTSMRDSSTFILPTDTLFIHASTDDKLINDWMHDKKQAYYSRSGVEFGINYDARIGDKVADSDLDDEFVEYANRLQATLEWNVMSCGLIGRVQYAERVGLEGEQLLIKRQKEAFVQNASIMFYNQQHIIHAFYNKTLDMRMHLLDLVIDLQTSLKDRDKVYAAEIIELNYQLSLLKGRRLPSDRVTDMFMNCQRYVESQNLDFSLNIDSLAQNSFEIKQLDTESALLQNKTNTISIWEDIKISPYAKWTYSDNMSSPNRIFGYGNVGVRVKIPVDLNANARKKEADSRRRVHDAMIVPTKNRITRDISLVLEQMRHNYNTLLTVYEAEKLYMYRIDEERKRFDAKKSTIQTLFKEYDRLLECRMNLYEIILKREELKLNLALAIDGFVMYK